MRAFLSIFPSNEITACFREYRQLLKKQKQNLTFFPASQVHLTIKFLGPDVGEDTIYNVSNDFRNYFSKVKSFDVVLGQVKFGFKNETKPRVLIIYLKNKEKVASIAKDIEDLTPKSKYKDLYPPRNKYVPHMALARIKGNIHGKKIEEIREAIETHHFSGYERSFIVDSVVLLKSDLGKDGPVYSILEKFKFA